MYGPILTQIIFKSRGHFMFIFEQDGVRQEMIIKPGVAPEEREALRQHLLSTYRDRHDFTSMDEAEQALRRAIFEYKKEKDIPSTYRERNKIDPVDHIQFRACSIIRPSRGKCKISMPVIVNGEKRTLVVSTGLDDIDDDRRLKHYIEERCRDLKVKDYETARGRVEEILSLFLDSKPKASHRKKGQKIPELPEVSVTEISKNMKLVGPYILQDKVLGCKFLVVNGEKRHAFIFSFYRALSIPTAEVKENKDYRNLAKSRIDTVLSFLVTGLNDIAETHPGAFVTERNPSRQGKRIKDDKERQMFETLQHGIPSFPTITPKDPNLIITL